MFKITERRQLSKDTFQVTVHAPAIAKKAQAGQFVIIRTDDKGERIPISIADWDDERLVLVVTVVGESTRDMGALKKGDSLLDISGPLGKPSVIGKGGTVAVIGGGCGAAACYPISKELKKKGNRVVSIIGARTKDSLVWIDRMEKVSDELILATDDGSAGVKGFVTDALEKAMNGERFDRVIAIGPVIMMKNVSAMTKGVDTIVSLNPIMVDGIGMCGACRVIVSGESRFACVEGPEFDGHEVDWDNLLDRNTCYDEECSCRK